MNDSETKFKAGDAMPGSRVGRDWQITQRSTTILEILDLPESEKNREELARATIARYHLEREMHVTIISGENLADDPKRAPFVDCTKVYVIEA